ncbi:MAG: hypothetical protein Ct9H300mP16_17220 [Pseudomonadota bacterium]|nr:MAG: hypothetical protein Ct9H300mP16_17220 [Pseudomonadota bacterium]
MVGPGILLLLVVTGRIPWIFAALSAAFAVAAEGDDGPAGFGAFSGRPGDPAQRKPQKLKTVFLRMTLDHFPGVKLGGEVIAGSFSGQLLKDLDLDRLLVLLGECPHRGCTVCRPARSLPGPLPRRELESPGGHRANRHAVSQRTDDPTESCGASSGLQKTLRIKKNRGGPSTVLFSVFIPTGAGQTT